MTKPIRTYDLYDVVKVPFPFTDQKTVKVRPAVIISSARHFNAKIGMSVMAMITSFKSNQVQWPSDILIENILLAGLPVPSIIRFKLFTLDHRLILAQLGSLGESDQKKVYQKLKEILVL